MIIELTDNSFLTRLPLFPALHLSRFALVRTDFLESCLATLRKTWETIWTWHTAKPRDLQESLFTMKWQEAVWFEHTTWWKHVWWTPKMIARWFSEHIRWHHGRRLCLRGTDVTETLSRPLWLAQIHADNTTPRRRRAADAHVHCSGCRLVERAIPDMRFSSPTPNLSEM